MSRILKWESYYSYLSVLKSMQPRGLCWIGQAKGILGAFTWLRAFTSVKLKIKLLRIYKNHFIYFISLLYNVVNINEYIFS